MMNACTFIAMLDDVSRFVVLILAVEDTKSPKVTVFISCYFARKGKQNLSQESCSQPTKIHWLARQTASFMENLSFLKNVFCSKHRLKQAKLIPKMNDSVLECLRVGM